MMLENCGYMVDFGGQIKFCGLEDANFYKEESRNYLNTTSLHVKHGIKLFCKFISLRKRERSLVEYKQNCSKRCIRIEKVYDFTHMIRDKRINIQRETDRLPFTMQFILV